MSQTQQNEIDYTDLPEGLRDGVRWWVEQGLVPGSFLRSVIRGQLFEAAQRADSANFRELGRIALWFTLHAPEGSYGNDRALGNWQMFLRAQANQEASVNG